MSLQIEKFGHAKIEDIHELEKEFNIVLPKDYKQFLLDFNGGKTIDYELNKISIPHSDGEINLDLLFGVRPDEQGTDIGKWTEEYIDDILEHSLIIGDTVQHGFIIIWISGDENEGVYYYDHTYTLASSYDGGNAYYLASTFTEFLSLLTS
ncbi:SMI1/KNR4 family protein [Streptococcus suis]|uniref:SMI1/KNR4 family protein n=1 Tax=Streptococcus suis TaxID=1307 RepID=UPI0015538AF5|nr:SMI1/KNR4 family protein [Streptococcus suis]WAX25079.1 1, 3-beta-glucan synthase regulator [Streptococcus phage YS771]NQK56631.1 SMI1/KNR4 family protein [Streptococcus suis]NQK57089.1 SMI1/KNR4 family protein [Streptococcus suis]NQP17521.1 SMI1/KNR4 family protein [Streptococcus suis]